ncbi:hypothetical protein Tco_1162183 [Tanacetum coccineum]
MKNYKNVSKDIRNLLNAEAEAVHIILTGIDNDTYSTVDVCPNAMKMWKAIKRLKQGESINVQDLETNLSQQAATRNRGKAPPIYDQEPDMITENDALSKEKEIDKLIALISLSFKKIYKPTNNNLRTSSNTSRANQDNTSRINKGNGYDNLRAVECQKPKRAKDASYHKENMLLYKQKEDGVQLSAKQVDWRDDTDDEPEDQELEAHYLYMAQIQEVTPDAADNSGPVFDTEPLQKQPESVNDTYLGEQGDTNITNDSFVMSNNGENADQDDDDLARERDLLASLIEKLKVKLMTAKTVINFWNHQTIL